MFNLLKKYKVIVSFILGVLATLAAQTSTFVDDKLVALTQDAFNEYVKNTSETVVTSVSPASVVTDTVVLEVE